MGPPNSTDARAELDRMLPTDAYGLSKWRAECGLHRELSGASMAVVIVRPALVYGAHIKGNLRQLAWAVRRGLPRPPPGGGRSMVALDDLVDLLCIVAQNPPPGTHTWIACGDRDYSTQTVYDLLREALGMGRGTGWLPRWGWRVGAGLLDLATGQRGGSTYTRLFGTELYSNAAVRADTTWRPRRRLEDVVGQIAGAQGAQG
jgi:nucleoside-diphosphate-sugar epimerase